MMKAHRILRVLLGLWVLALVPASAVNEKGEWPWNEKLHGWHDRAVAEDLGTGWFLNVGSTGLRARITHEHPEFLTIKYVFKNSPANGPIKINDIVVGANGKKRYDPNNEAGFPAWSYGYDGILMGEYYLLTKNRSLLPAIESLNNCLALGQTPDSGGFSHKPFPAIQQRIAAGGPKGYGDMAMPGGLTMLAMSLFKEAGLPYAAPAHERIHQSYLCSMTSSGAIDYGFKDWDHAVIELSKAAGPPKNSPLGIGYLCSEGMTGIGEYKITWPTKADPRYKPTDWLAKETATNQVFDMGGVKRLVIRTMLTKEPTKPYQHDGNPCDHYGRTGVGALANSIGNGGNKSWGFVADFLATGAAKSSKGLLDGHASTHIHVLWGSLGAALASEKDFREYMEGIKWWFIMAQAHDGGLVVMPGRDYASTDHVYGTRNLPSACAALILSLKKKHLQITGAPRRSGTAAVPEKTITGRKARTISPEKRALLDDSLLTALAELSHAGELKPLPMSISKAQSKVWLAKVEKDHKLVFQAIDGDQQASFTLSDLTAADQVWLARLAAKLRPTESESQARAGIYLELNSETATADEFYEKAGPGIKEKLDALFE